MNRAFKGVWIPKEIWLTKDLNSTEKLMLTEISSLDNEDGCIAGNSWFSEFFGLSKSRCSEIITSLSKKGYITVELTPSGSRTLRRQTTLRDPETNNILVYNNNNIKETNTDTCKNKGGKKTTGKPTNVKEVDEYLKSLNETSFTGQTFWDHYEAIGWVRVVGVKEIKIKSWKSVVRTWVSRRNNQSNGNDTPETPSKYRQAK